jgi:excisionase family DNA binding protein
MKKVTKEVIKVNETLLSEQSAAAYLNISYSKLRLSVRPKKEISFYRFGSSIRYTLQDLDNYIATKRVEAVN